MTRLALIWKSHPFLGTVFVLTAAVTGFFLIRAAIFFLVWSDPDRAPPPIQPWMTPRYVGRGWDIPRNEMVQLLGLPPKGEYRRRLTLEDIAEDQGIAVEELINRINAHVADRPDRRR